MYPLIAAVLAATLPALYFEWFYGQHLEPVTTAVVFGVGILAAAFILSWAAEVAQMDVSRGLALAVLALIAVLPEYAVDLYFAWEAARNPEYIHYATANMTGANRLLVGLGWPFIMLLFYLKFRKKQLDLDPAARVEISYLTIATIYALFIPLKGTLTLWDCLILVALFGAYAWRTAFMEVHEPELVGPARLVGALSTGPRRIVTLLLFLYAGLVIYSSAEPFAEALVESGKVLGIDEFLLVQWIAPLASEAPEFIIAALWTLRGDAKLALGALISSKVNQWTLLVGTIPLVYSISLGAIGEVPLDTRQNHEVLLTAAQSIFAVAMLVDLRVRLWEMAVLFGLFIVQFVYPNIRVEVSIAYLILALGLLVPRWRNLGRLMKEGPFPRRAA
ncbi:MAG: sodium:calcium antiporter [Acidobacteria bacterium]|nr:MAG: sodium:calcium antiporter [Acidobacteriota bacterium]